MYRHHKEIIYRFLKKQNLKLAINQKIHSMILMVIHRKIGRNKHRKKKNIKNHSSTKVLNFPSKTKFNNNLLKSPWNYPKIISCHHLQKSTIGLVSKNLLLKISNLSVGNLYTLTFLKAYNRLFNSKPQNQKNRKSKL